MDILAAGKLEIAVSQHAPIHERSHLEVTNSPGIFAPVLVPHESLTSCGGRFVASTTTQAVHPQPVENSAAFYNTDPWFERETRGCDSFVVYPRDTRYNISPNH